MTKYVLGFFLVLSTSFANASSTPITEDVVLKNKTFSELIFKALEKKAESTQTGAVKTVMVKGLIKCDRIVGIARTDFKCILLKGAWNSLGSEIYSSSNRGDLTKKFYDSLSVKVTVEEGMKFKNIEHDEEDPHGGTERNVLSCTRVGKEAEEMGLRDTCQLMNGL